MLISFAGIDGSGKSSQVTLLHAYFTSIGKKSFISKAYHTKEKKVFERYLAQCDQVAMMFLFQALHVQQRITTSRALEKGEIVIADRWDESYIAYHRRNGVLAKDSQLRETLNKLAFADMTPCITFYIRTPVHICRMRTVLRGNPSIFDEKEAVYHQAFSDELDNLAIERKWIVLEGEKPQDEIHNRIISNLPL